MAARECALCAIMRASLVEAAVLVHDQLWINAKPPYALPTCS